MKDLVIWRDGRDIDARIFVGLEAPTKYTQVRRSARHTARFIIPACFGYCRGSYLNPSVYYIIALCVRPRIDQSQEIVPIFRCEFLLVCPSFSLIADGELSRREENRLKHLMHLTRASVSCESSRAKVLAILASSHKTMVWLSLDFNLIDKLYINSNVRNARLIVRRRPPAL